MHTSDDHRNFSASSGSNGELLVGVEKRSVDEKGPQSDTQSEKPSYDYPYPEDVDSDFRKKCRERFQTVLTYAWKVL